MAPAARDTTAGRRRVGTQAGWTVVFATAEDLADPVQLVARIAGLLTRR